MSPDWLPEHSQSECQVKTCHMHDRAAEAAMLGLYLSAAHDRACDVLRDLSWYHLSGLLHRQDFLDRALHCDVLYGHLVYSKQIATQYVYAAGVQQQAFNAKILAKGAHLVGEGLCSSMNASTSDHATTFTE